jgi:hypothetical protein
VNTPAQKLAIINSFVEILDHNERFLENYRADFAKVAEWTPAMIHRLADKHRVKWDNDQHFMAMCRRLTGQAHLDKMDAAQLKAVAEALTDGMRNA